MTDEAVNESAMALLLYMDAVATSAKTGSPLALPYLEADAIEIMPDGVCIYHRERFLTVMTKQIMEGM